ncbi:MAG: tetratricopeptide repeat protein [Pyrinomonadaceae bacterium]
MNKNTAFFVILAVIAGFIAGFIVANKLNGSEMATLKAQAGQPKPTNANSAASQDPTDTTLTAEELKAKIEEADKNPTNLSYQKNLGVSLYRYAAMKQDAALLDESIRILTRANSLDAKDFDVLVALGNAHFDVGFFKKSASSFQTARDIYAKALAVKPGDADVQTDLGISYFVQEPPMYEKAVLELQQVLIANPKHDRAMQFLVQTYIKQGKISDAEKTLAKIIEINPSNPAIADLRSLISAAKSSAN